MKEAASKDANGNYGFVYHPGQGHAVQPEVNHLAGPAFAVPQDPAIIAQSQGVSQNPPSPVRNQALPATILVSGQVLAKGMKMTDWSQIVQDHGPMVWRTVHRLVNHEADAADCFQRTFVSALELSRAEAIRNWPGLLKRLATARAMDCLRQRQRKWNRWTALRERLPVDRKTIEPVLAAETSELADHLRQALSELDDRQAQVFCLACLEGWSYEEIAGQLDLNVNHVGVLLNRARAILQEKLHAFEPAAVRRQREEKS